MSKIHGYWIHMKRNVKYYLIIKYDTKINVYTYKQSRTRYRATKMDGMLVKPG